MSPGIWTSRNTRSGCRLLDYAQRLDAVARLADDLDAAELPEQEAQLVARELLVVDHDVARSIGVYAGHAVTRSGTASGISMRAHVPSPGTLVSCSW